MISFVRAVRVKLDGEHLVDSSGNIGSVWDLTKVDDLLVFPEIRQARCLIGGILQVALYLGYTPEPLSQRAWEGPTTFTCDDCGRTFENSQGLGNHMATKHGKKVAK